MADHSDAYQHHHLPPPPPDHYHQQQQQYNSSHQQPQPAQHYAQTDSYASQQHPYHSQQPQEQQYPPLPPSQQQRQQQQYPPLTAPQRPQNTHQRTATSSSASKSRTFSFQSQKSHKSSGSKEIHDLHETHAEKEAKRLHSKADPTLAISEAEPSVVAMTQSSLAPLRSIQHKDTSGNPIAEPDRSNPTRSRWERPLDTIRSFEAAIDGGYSRKSLYRTETDSAAQWNRRSSYHQGPSQPPRFQRESYYGQRPGSYQPYGNGYDSSGPATARNSYFEQQGGYSGPYGQGPPPRRLSRMQTEPHYQSYSQGQNIYPMPHKDRSYETVTSAAASGNSDHAGYQTDPTSSDNSSIERRSPAKRPEPQNDYGIGFAQPQAYQAPSFTVGVPANSGRHPLPAAPGQQQPSTPQVPRKDAPSVLRRPVASPEAATEKRKSWFTRRFSKNG